MSQARQESVSILIGASTTITLHGFETIPQLKKDFTTEARRSQRRDQEYISLCSLCLRGECSFQDLNADRVAAVSLGGFCHGQNVFGWHVGLDGVHRAQNETPSRCKVLDALADFRRHLIH